MKKLLLAIALMALTGCATHAVVEQAVIQKINSENFNNKSIKYGMLYSQPMPGVFTGGEQQPLQPIKDVKLSVASAKVLGRLNEVLSSNLPNTSSFVKDGGDLQLQVAITARHKKGPTFADYDMAASMGKAVLTFGLGSSEYTIIADFDVEYTLANASGQKIYSEKFTVKDALDHERGGYEGHSINDELAAQLLEKHINLTFQKFIHSADKKMG